MKKCENMLWKSQRNKIIENTSEISINNAADFSLKIEPLHGHNLTILSKLKEKLFHRIHLKVAAYNCLTMSLPVIADTKQKMKIV